jgi:hypothetical protein
MKCYIINWPNPVGLENIICFYRPQTENEVEEFDTIEEAVNRVKTYNINTKNAIIKHTPNSVEITIKLR